MIPRMYGRLPGLRCSLSPSPKRFVNYKVYFPPGLNDNAPKIDPKSAPHGYQFKNNSVPPPSAPKDTSWKDGRRWPRWTTYTASSMTVGLLWIWYKYREPIYCNERMQLSFLSDQDVVDYLYARFDKLMDQLGICFEPPFAVTTENPGHTYIKEIFDHLIAAGKLEGLELDLYLMVSDRPVEISLGIHPYAIVVNLQELATTESSSDVAVMLATRIARQALNHQSELLNHFVFACLATVPAILLGAVALCSKGARTIAVPYICYYGAVLAFQNTLLRSRQLNEADYVGLVIMGQAGYDVSPASKFRGRQVKLGEEWLEGGKEFYEKVPSNPLMIRDYVEWKLGLTPPQRWVGKQRIHAENVEKFVPMVLAELAAKAVYHDDKEKPEIQGEGRGERDNE